MAHPPSLSAELAHALKTASGIDFSRVELRAVGGGIHRAFELRGEIAC